MIGHTKDWLAVGVPLLAVLVVSVAVKANSWSDVLVTALTVAVLAGLVGLIVMLSRPLPGEGQGQEEEGDATGA